MTVGTLGGLVINLLGWRLPELIVNPIALLGGMAVPAMLVAFGASLRLGPMPVVSGAGETLLISAIKLLVQPLAALLLARFAFRLDLAATLAVTVMAGLPAAQNVFMFATRYRESVQLARDVVLITTISSIFTLMGWAGLVHTL
jgi:predicted permease